MATQNEKTARFRALHERPGVFVMPNPWDVGSARLLASLGFEALATTSAGFAWTLGKPDGGVTREEALAHCRAICAAVDVPVNADLENCFDDSPEGVAQTIRFAGATGLSGASIEDSTGDPGKPIYDFGHAVERVRAGVSANSASAVPMLITARAENFLHGRRDLADTIRRLQAYEAAGADVLYAPGLATLEEFRAVIAAVQRPFNALVGGHNADLTTAQLAEVGAKRISIGGAFARAALGAMMQAAREIKDQGVYTYAKSAMPAGEINKTFKEWGST